MAVITEDQIEKTTINVFVDNLGYRHINCFFNDGTGRENEKDVVIKPLLRRKLREINPSLSADILDEAYNQLISTRFDKSEIQANREVYQHIRDGVQLSSNNHRGEREPVTVKVIDLHDESKNDYLVVSQMWIKGDLRLRPDLIVFINGLPLVFIELKNSNVAVRNAYNDNLIRYRKQIPLLFRYNALCILSNGIETKAGSFNAGYEYFFNWLRPENESHLPDQKKIKSFGVSLDYAVLGLCEKKRLLDYFENFIFFYNETVKISAKNHQFLGVNNAVNNFSMRLQHDRTGTDKENKGKLGVFWHTQGSGKSFSMIFFTRKIFRQFRGNFTFLIVTDREDLDGQIYRNFLGAGAFSKDTKCQPASGEDLRLMLQSNTRYIFTLIQKFRFDKGNQYPILSTRNDIIVIVDEAHRTQYKDLAENMRTGLPNAQYIAFTGTPLLGSRELTRSWFGKTISEYNFKQSIDDGATVPLFYNKHVPQVVLQNSDLDDDLADIVVDENLTEEQQERLEREFAQELSVLKADDRLEIIAKDIVNHFPRRGYLGKGMVVCVDKFTAVRMFDKVRRHWEEEKRALTLFRDRTEESDEKTQLKNILDWMRETEMAVILSEEAGEDEKFEKEDLDIRFHRKRMVAVDENGQEIEDNFKNPHHRLRLVFVCSMWLTGFDAPTVSTLYLDKPMKDHTLMQTIARANRVTDHLILGKPKMNGMIVDYYNVFRNLKKAFASYGAGSLSDEFPVKDSDNLFGLLRDTIAECNQFCSSIGVDLQGIMNIKSTFNQISLFEEYADQILGNEEWKTQFFVYDNTIDALYEACKPEIIHRKNEFKLASVVHYLRQVIDGQAVRENLDSAKRRISQLLNDSLIADDITQDNEGKHYSPTQNRGFAIKAWRQIDLSKLDVEKLRTEFKQAVYKNIEIEDLRAFIESKLKAMIDQNVTRKRFAEKLQEIIDKYNSGNSLNEDYHNDLMDFVSKMKDEEQRAAREGLTEDELEIFDLLWKEKLTSNEEQKVKLAAKNLLQRLHHGKPKVLIVDWHKDQQTKIQVQDVIQTVLDEELPKSYDRAIYASKCDAVFQHYYLKAMVGNQRAFV